MAEKKSKPDDQESSEFATQKFTPEELMGKQSEAVKPEQATRKIDDSILEAAVAKEALDSAATMKVPEAELKQAMEEMPAQALKTPSAPKALEPVAVVQESPKSEKPVEGKSSIVSKIDPTVATILGVALVLTACICSCALVIAAIAASGRFM